MTVTILTGDCRSVLATLPAESVHCVVTSPPYWGLRDYGVDGQLGMESTYGEHVDVIVDVFREVHRVLRTDGTLWLNYGDSYATSVNGRSAADTKAAGNDDRTFRDKPFSTIGGVLKSKDLCGIPWRVAFALQADGWVLRQEIIWSKVNPMPESVRDRCTKSHESIFLFCKAKWSGPKGGRFARILDQDARWLAALIDAEGCIAVKRCQQHPGRADTFAPQVAFGSTSRALIDEFVRLAGHGNALERPGKNAPMFYWQIAHNVARDFLHRIYPWLIVKKRQARIGIFVDDLTYYRGGKRPERKQRSEAEERQLISLWDRNKQCNRFECPDLSDVPEPTYGRWADCERYFYDAEAIAETAKWAEDNRAGEGRLTYNGKRQGAAGTGNEAFVKISDMRNKRSVWEVPTQPFPEAHFATFPPALIEPCILAGCPKGGTVLDPFWRRRHDRPGGRPPGPQRHPDRTQSRICRNGPPAHLRRRPTVRGGHMPTPRLAVPAGAPARHAPAQSPARAGNLTCGLLPGRTRLAVQQRHALPAVVIAEDYAGLAQRLLNGVDGAGTRIDRAALEIVEGSQCNVRSVGQPLLRPAEEPARGSHLFSGDHGRSPSAAGVTPRYHNSFNAFQHGCNAYVRMPATRQKIDGTITPRLYYRLVAVDKNNNPAPALPDKCDEINVEGRAGR